jgi:hypothetical protein
MENSVQTDENGNIYVTSNGSVLSGDSLSGALPDQTGQSGKFLTTDGTNASWATVDALPGQTGQSGKFLTTNGSAASWATVDALPSQSGQSGKFLTTDGTDASWSSIDLSNYQTTTNLVTSISSSSTDSQYPSAKLLYDTVGDIESLINSL